MPVSDCLELLHDLSSAFIPSDDVWAKFELLPTPPLSPESCRVYCDSPSGIENDENSYPDLKTDFMWSCAPSFDVDAEEEQGGRHSENHAQHQSLRKRNRGSVAAAPATRPGTPHSGDDSIVVCRQRQSAKRARLGQSMTMTARGADGVGRRGGRVAVAPSPPAPAPPSPLTLPLDSYLDRNNNPMLMMNDDPIRERLAVVDEPPPPPNLHASAPTKLINLTAGASYKDARSRSQNASHRTTPYHQQHQYVSSTSVQQSDRVTWRREMLYASPHSGLFHPAIDHHSAPSTRNHSSTPPPARAHVTKLTLAPSPVKRQPPAAAGGSGNRQSLNTAGSAAGGLARQTAPYAGADLKSNDGIALQIQAIIASAAADSRQ